MGKKSRRRANKGGSGGGSSSASSFGPHNSSVGLTQSQAVDRMAASVLDGTHKPPDIYTDEYGRTFCAEHRREQCHICCMSFSIQNRLAEEEAGLRKKRTPVEEAAEEYATSVSALRGMEHMQPHPTEEVFEQNREWKRQAEEKLRRFEEDGEDVRSAIQRATDVQRTNELEREALAQSLSRLNPGQTEFEVGGPETQKIYDEFISGPQGKATRADFYSCSFCGKTDTEKLSCCSRCMKESYCSHECQSAAWPVHKKDCVRADKKPKKLPLTWEQVEAHQGTSAKGTLEVKAIKDESMMRQVFQCKDRVGICRRIAAYTDSRSIPGLRVGSTVKWKNPRFHYFMDGSGGARIEEEDLEDVTVS